ncbi:MAG: four helix bundle protein [bacterium]|nr:four helix bundle protein [bacterium]
MEKDYNKIQSFKDLIAWQEGHKLVLIVYDITKLFPKDEQFGLSSQLRRAVVSITSNIAEGFSRKSLKEKIQFYSMSHGSLTEVENQLIIAKDVRYISQETFNNTSDVMVVVSKTLNGLIKSLRSLS